ncbi:MAG TPA: response regulator [Ideonella sp.]|uniref:response regulator n=1 Tax=Ideonella sp. TaxID=1929293 RepID=UPI002CCE7F21|nr:response regulator [Ideonella sp.]HSI49851.1 response regulator [Ideonella sp.]
MLFPLIRNRRWWLAGALMLPAGLALTWWMGASGASGPPGLSASSRGPVCWLLAGLALAWGLAWWGQRRVMRPLRRLQASLQALQAGQPLPAGSTGLAALDEPLRALALAATVSREAQQQLQQRLEAAQDQAREAEQRATQRQRLDTLGRLAAGVAHDVNNLLGVISNSAHLIGRLAPPHSPVAQPLAAILRSVDSGSRLTQRLLHLSDRHPLQPRPVDLARQLDETCEVLRSVLGRRITLRCSVAAGTWPVQVDPDALELALVQLALNARDAVAQQGSVWLRARNAGPQDCAGLPASATRAVLVTLDDDGCGLDETLAERVFEPFFSTKPLGEGTGLGLTQVQAFCAESGGLAQLASTPGLGTTVSLLLPAARTAAAVPARRSGTEEAMAGARVLVVDDNEELGQTTGLLLSCYGCEVSWAANAAEALQKLEDEPFDALLSDVVMPGGIDGLTLARMLRRERPTLPVVLISGYSAALAEVHDFIVLRKPCAPGPLLAALRRAMAEKAMPRETRR